MDRRISVRVSTQVGIECRLPAIAHHAVMRDLSLHGCRIETERPVAQTGGTAVLELSEWISVSGTIVWTHGMEAGIRFAEPLDLGRYCIHDWIEATEPGLSAKLAAASEAA